MYHVAQVNVARMRAPLDDPLMAEFVAQLDPINALADASAGFVWRLQALDGNATVPRPFGDDLILVNLSTWASLAELMSFVYASRHRQVMRQRRQWFDRFDARYVALWWIPAGHIPSVEEARERLDALQERGDTPYAFSFKQPFPAPDEAVARVADGVAAVCGA